MLRGIQRLVRVRKLSIDSCLEVHDIQNGLAPTNHSAQSHHTVRGVKPIIDNRNYPFINPCW